MAHVSNIEANNTSYGIRATAIPYGVVDNTSTSTAYTVTVPGITELTDGVCCLIKNGKVTSESGFTLNVNGLGAKPSYSNMATGNPVTPTSPTRDTTIFNINYTMLFIYNSTLVDGGAWICYRGYDANTNTIGYQIRHNSSTLPTSQKFYRYRLLFTSADGTHYVPANTSSSTNATSSRTVNQTPIDPFGEILYYGSTTAVDANARPAAASLWQEYALTFGYSFNRTNAALTLTSWKPVYIKCAPQSNGSAIIDADTPYVQDLPTTADGKIYIFIGIAYSATAIELLLSHPVYYHDGTGIRIWTGKTIPAAITVDSTITQNGINPVQGGAIYSALEGKEDRQQVLINFDIEQSSTTFTDIDNNSVSFAQLKALLDNPLKDVVMAGNGRNLYTMSIKPPSAEYDQYYYFQYVSSDELAVYELIVDFDNDECTIDRYSVADSLSNYVRITRKINNKPLSTDITLTASDVGAVPTSISTTYANLVTARTNSQLKEDAWYRITDYTCTTTQTDTQSAGHQFDILVQATSSNTLSEEARAICHSGDTYFTNSNLEAWKIWYCLDNDTTRFAWADETNGKGVIYRMIDEWNNDCPYDFKNIQFKRDLTDGKLDTDNGTTTWVYTFNWWDGNNEVCKDASIFGNTMRNDEGFVEGIHKNRMGVVNAYDLYLGDGGDKTCFVLNDNVFLTTGEDWEYYGCYNNILGIGCYKNTFGSACYSNLLEVLCNNNTFGADCIANTLEIGCNSNTFLSGSSRNCLRKNNTSNSFGNNCNNNVLGCGCNRNIFSGRCSAIILEEECSLIKFQRANIRYVIVESGNTNINITSTQPSSNRVQNITIAQGTNTTDTTKTISHNTVNDTFRTTYTTDVNGNIYAITPTKYAEWDAKADPVPIVTVSTTGAVTQALDPNKFYNFTGSPTSLTLTLNSGTGLCIYAGKFTAGTGFSNLTLPSTVKVADGAPSVEAGGVYEFSVMNNLLLLAKEGS